MSPRKRKKIQAQKTPEKPASSALILTPKEVENSIPDNLIYILVPLIATVLIGASYILNISVLTKVIITISILYITSIVIIFWILHRNKKLRQIHIMISIYLAITTILGLIVMNTENINITKDNINTITAQIIIPSSFPVNTIDYINSQIASLSFRPTITNTPSNTPLLLSVTPTLTKKFNPIYSDNKGGTLLNYGCTDWMTCRTARYSNNYTPNQYSGLIRASFLSAANYEVGRILLFFTTSEIPSNAKIINANLHLCSAHTIEGNTKIHIVESNASSNFGVYDFSRIGNVSGGNIELVSENECGEIEFTSEALSWIKRGTIVLAVIHDYDLYNIKPIIENKIEIALSLDKDNRPYIKIEYENA